jgi:hypothetical protein
VGIGTDTSSLAGAATLTVNGDASITGLLGVSSAGIRFNDGTTQTTAGGGGGAVSAVANGSNNRVATFSSADALNGEANLTFDGSTLAVDGSVGIGTDTASVLLHVEGSIKGSFSYQGAAANANTRFLVASTPADTDVIDYVEGDQIIYTLTVSMAKNDTNETISTTVSVNGSSPVTSATIDLTDFASHGS